MEKLQTLLLQLDPNAQLAERHVWLIRLFEWIRGDASSVNASVSRLQTFISAVQASPELEVRLKAWWHTLAQTVDVTTLLADFGFAPRTAFISELGERLRRKLLPGTPETLDASELFPLVATSRFDAQWMSSLEEPQVTQIVNLLSSEPEADRLQWQHNLIDALTYSTAQVRATGFAPELRLRMNRAAGDVQAFRALPSDVEDLRSALFGVQRDEALLQSVTTRYRNRLDACRQAISSIYAHLEEHGISIGMVFRLRQLRARIMRVRELLDALLAPSPAMMAVRLLVRRVIIAQESKSIGALISANSTFSQDGRAQR
jgi:site-specific recombinase